MKIMVKTIATPSWTMVSLATRTWFGLGLGLGLVLGLGLGLGLGLRLG